MPIFQYRFGRGLQRLRFLVDEGVAGSAYLTTIETAWRRRSDYYATWHGRWETELGGALVTLAVHAHDALTYILGPVSRVLAHTATLVNPIETEDCVASSLEMADGSLASLSVTTGSTVQISRHLGRPDESEFGTMLLQACCHGNLPGYPGEWILWRSIAIRGCEQGRADDVRTVVGTASRNAHQLKRTFPCSATGRFFEAGPTACRAHQLLR